MLSIIREVYYTTQKKHNIAGMFRLSHTIS